MCVSVGAAGVECVLGFCWCIYSICMCPTVCAYCVSKGARILYVLLSVCVIRCERFVCLLPFCLTVQSTSVVCARGALQSLRP